MNTKSIIIPAFVAFAGLFLAMMPLYNNVFAADVATNNPNDHSLKGALTSIQNDANGKPAWIVSGVFKIDNFNIKKIESPVLNATFYMIKLDGGSPHTHTISNFKMIGTPKNNSNSTTTINGTSTITMKEGPVTGVPTTVKIFDKSAISIMLDPSKVKNHFGSTPIYGTHHLICVEKPQYCK